MNNIEILEDITITSFNCSNIIYLNLEEVNKALENLIQENKELKETNKKLYELCQGNAMQEFINNECGFIPKSKVKEKIEILEKCTTKIDKKVNLTDYMIIGETERAVGRFVNLDFIKKVLLEEPGYDIELLEEGE